MASLLLNCECVDLKNKTYKMTWWATALNQISVPDNMNMCGGSIAVVTASNGVKTYVYNSATGAWKEKSGVDVSGIETDIEQLKTGLSSLTTVVAGMVDGGNYSLAGNPIPANGGINVDITFSKTFRTVPVIILTPFFITDSNANLANISLGVVQRSSTGFKARILNPTASQLTLSSFYWVAVEIT